MLRIDQATIVDPRDGSKRADMPVLMNMGQITDIFTTGSKANDPATKAIDARGKFLVPGYNDMHSHMLELPDPSGSLALMLAEGVTGFRQMSGSAVLLARRRAGQLPIGDAAPSLHETPGSVLTPFNAGSGEAAVEEIRRQREQGADFIKVRLFNPQVFFIALDECRRVGIPLLGHLQEGTDALEATAGGFRSIEHLGPGSTVWICCSKEEAELRADSYRRKLIKAPPFKIPFLEQIVMKKFAKLLINPSADPKQRALAKLLSDAGVSMMVGTDGGSFLGPGLTLRQEYKELSDAGISTLKILQMATVNAAKYLGKSATMGTVDIGKDADIVLLDRDPMIRIENFHSISGIIRRGYHYSRRQLDAMKDRVAATRGAFD